MSTVPPSDRAPLGPALSTPLVPSQWRMPLLTVVLLWLWILFLFRDTGAGMVAIWSRSDTFAHGFFVPPIALWLMWRQRRRLWTLVPTPMPWALAAMALCAFAWLTADLVAANAPSQLALVALLVLTVPCLLGWQVARALMFPLGFLFFAVPLGEFMLEPLMEGTATFTVVALRASGIPVYRDGLQFVIPSGYWSVVEACSGVRYLIASLTVGTLYAYLNYQTAAKRWLFVGVSILVPIVANWVRAYLIVLLGHLSGNKLGVGVDHLIYGWVFFGVVILTMFMIGSRWADADPPQAATRPMDVAFSAGQRQRLWSIALAAAVLVVIAPWMSGRLAAAGDSSVPRLMAPERLADGWTQLAQAPTDWTPGFQNPAAELQTGYGNGQRTVGLYIGFYRNQQDDSKLVSSANTLTPKSMGAWSRVPGSARTLQLERPPIEVRSVQLRDALHAGHLSQQSLRVWQWYWVGDRWTSDDRVAKVYGALQRLLGQGDDSAVLIVYTAADDGADPALQGFMQANLGHLQRLLQRVKEP